MNLELKKFDMKNISFKPNENQGPVIVLIGRRDTGKSYLVRDLLYYQQDIPIGTVISGTEAGNGFYGKMVPKLFIHDEYNTAIIENILKRQKIVMKQMKKENEKFASDDTNKITKNDVEMNTVEKPELNKNKAEEPEKSEKQYVTSNNNEQQAQNINLIIETPKTELSDKEDVKNTVKETVDTLVNSISAATTVNKETTSESSSRLSFNDKDSVLDMGTNKSKEINAPKTIKRLEKISKDQNEKRKIEEAEEDDEDDDETLQIMDNTSIKLDTLDIHSLDKEVKLEPNIILDNIEVLT